MAMEEKPSQALVPATSDRSAISMKDIASRARKFQCSFNALDTPGEEGVLHRVRRIMHYLGEYPIVEAYDRALVDLRELTRFGLLEKNITDLLALKNSASYAHLSSVNGIARDDLDWILELFQRDLQAMKFFSDSSVNFLFYMQDRSKTEKEENDRVACCFLNYECGLRWCMGRYDIGEEEVCGLLKNHIAHLEELKRDQSFIYLCKRQLVDMDEMLGLFRRDVQLLSDPEIKSLFDALSLAKSVSLGLCYSYHSVKDYKSSFKLALHRDVSEKEVLELLKQCIDNIKMVKENRLFADIGRLCALNAPKVELLIADFQKDLDIFSDSTADFSPLAVAQSIIRKKERGSLSPLGGYQVGLGLALGRHVRLNEVCGLLTNCVENIERLKQNKHFADAYARRFASGPGVDERLSSFRRDLEMLADPECTRLLDVFDVTEQIYSSLYKGDEAYDFNDVLTFDQLQRFFAHETRRNVNEKEAFGLFKKWAADLAAAQDSPRFADACRLCGIDKDFIDDLLGFVAIDLQVLAEAEVKSDAAVVGSAGSLTIENVRGISRLSTSRPSSLDSASRSLSLNNVKTEEE